MKHTPGPWTMREQYIRVKDSTRTIDVFAIVANHGEDTICEIPQEDGEPEANARLIAAAPELLEALKEQIEPRAKGWRVTDWKIRDANAHAALAKAKGRS